MRAWVLVLVNCLTIAVYSVLFTVNLLTNINVCIKFAVFTLNSKISLTNMLIMGIRFYFFQIGFSCLMMMIEMIVVVHKK